jgi:hypothetical protein
MYVCQSQKSSFHSRPGWQDWANFRPIYDIWLGADLWIFQKLLEHLGYFSPLSINYALILTKNELGYILGDFFENSSGHPAPLQKPKKWISHITKDGTVLLICFLTDDIFPLFFRLVCFSRNRNLILTAWASVVKHWVRVYAETIGCRRRRRRRQRPREWCVKHDVWQGLQKKSSFGSTHCQGCQIFIGNIYQNRKNILMHQQIHIPNGHKLYKMSVKLTKWT